MTDVDLDKLRNLLDILKTSGVSSCTIGNLQFTFGVEVESTTRIAEHVTEIPPRNNREILKLKGFE